MASGFGTVLLSLLLVESSIAAPAPEPPSGWRMELIATAPDVRHPSVVCSAPDGRVFVAEDPMDVTVPANSNQGRIVCFHPDRPRTVFAEQLYAVFGMQYLEGKLYVLHNPKFSVFTDDNGVGRDRVDLIESTNPNPWALEWNDHVPANFKLAMDGYFYVAVGDKGVYGAVGRDGRRVDLPGGGILRLRPDGTQLEVYCTGVRNILDVALTTEDDIFTYDNTDEHDWMGRLTHMVEGGFYGYPHDFVPRRPYTLWMMHDFGAGAACGTEAYTEDALPAEYHDNLFLSDFGKRQVLRVRVERAADTWRVASHEEFFRNVPDDFRPVGIAVSADGLSLLICDWQHRDVKGTETVGRLWKATYAGPSRAAPKPRWYVPVAMGKPSRAPVDELIAALGHPSKRVRLAAQRELTRKGIAQSGGAEKNTIITLLAEILNDRRSPSLARIHALWAADALDGGESWRSSLRSAAGVAMSPDAEIPFQRQLARQQGLRRISADGLSSREPSIRLESAIAAGRIGRSNSIPALVSSLKETNLFTRYAAFTALNRIGRTSPDSWPAIAFWLNGETPIREGIEFALRETYDIKLLAALDDLAARAPNLDTRATALRLVAAMHRKLPEWKGEWGAYHPALAPPPAKTIEWAGTPRVLARLRATLADNAIRLRSQAVEGLRAARDTNAAPVLRERFARELDPAVKRALLATLGEFKDAEFSGELSRLLRNRSADADWLVEVIRAAGQIGGASLRAPMIELVSASTAPTAARAEAATILGQWKASAALPVLTPLLADGSRPLRVAAQRAVAMLGGAEALSALRGLLARNEVELRREALRALTILRSRDAVPDLLAAWAVPETQSEALTALGQVSDARALEAYLAGLGSANPAAREQFRKALTPVRDAALAALEGRAGQLSPEVLGELRRVYESHPTAKQGALFASTTRVLTVEDYERHAMVRKGDAVAGQRVFFDDFGVACAKCHAVAGHGGTIGPDLTLAGSQFPRAILIEHVLQPSKVVREGYQQTLVETRDGESLGGLLKGETADTLTLMMADGNLRTLPRSSVASRTLSQLSLMPEGLHAGLTLDQFSDLIAYLESRRVDARKPALRGAVPEGFAPLFENESLRGWVELPPGTPRVDAAMLLRGRPPEHWRVASGALEHDGLTGDLWTTRQFGDFELSFEWRFPDPPKLAEPTPIAVAARATAGGAAGNPARSRTLDAGAGAIAVRGLAMSGVKLGGTSTAGGTTARPLGDWNVVRVIVRGQRVAATFNGVETRAANERPDLPPRGPIGFLPEHERMQFRNVFLRELP